MPLYTRPSGSKRCLGAALYSPVHCGLGAVGRQAPCSTKLRSAGVSDADERCRGDCEHKPVGIAAGLAAVDEATGKTLYSWNPSVNTSLGMEAVAAANNRVAVGGQFTKVAGTNVQHFARFAE